MRTRTTNEELEQWWNVESSCRMPSLRDFRPYDLDSLFFLLSGIVDIYTFFCRFAADLLRFKQHVYRFVPTTFDNELI